MIREILIKNFFAGVEVRGTIFEEHITQALAAIKAELLKKFEGMTGLIMVSQVKQLIETECK